MFIYENGLPVGYRSDEMSRYSIEVQAKIEAEMLRWMRSSSGQTRRRRGKVDRMLGQEVNLDRMENE